MAIVEGVAVRLEIIVYIVTVLAVLKSLYNGWVRRRILTPLDRIEEIDERTERLEKNQQGIVEQQDRQTDALIALGESHYSDEEFDVQTAREEFDKNNGPSDFLGDD